MSAEDLAPLLPRTWAVGADGVSIGGVRLSNIAERIGTPAYVVDEPHVEARLAEFREAFGPDVTLVFAGKAALYGALVKLLDRAGWWIDVVSSGELAVAMAAGLEAGRTLMHGNAKPPSEIERAIEAGVARLVIDHPGEVDLVSGGAAALRAGDGEADPERDEVAVLIRLNADVAAVTHEKVRTTGAGAQFGMDARAAARAVERAARSSGVRPAGVHIHVGSQITDVDTFRRAARAVVEFAAPLRDAFGETIDLDLGGGLAVPYVRGDRAPPVAELAAALRTGLEEARAPARLGRYRLYIEPGRSVIATAGVTVYRVVARKRLPDGREVVAVDGGLSDNPRPSLYGQRYEVLPVGGSGGEPETPVRVVGRHCETGDLISDAAPLSAGLGPGDLVAVPVTGAYGYSMSSRYNGLARPPVVWVRDGEARVVVRRETIADLTACDLEIGPRVPGT